jgi:hypothetical protein
MQRDPRFVLITVDQPTPNQKIPENQFPFTVKGTAVPQPPATRVNSMGYDVDDGLIAQVIPIPPPPPMMPNKWKFSFLLADPGKGQHILTIHVFDDQGDLSETSVPYEVI